MGEFDRLLRNLQALLGQDGASGGSAGRSATAAGATEDASGVARTEEHGASATGATTGRAASDVGMARGGDAIEAELGRPARTTAVASLRESPEVEAFRGELVNGLIRVDTVNQLLRLVNELIARALV